MPNFKMGISIHCHQSSGTNLSNKFFALKIERQENKDGTKRIRINQRNQAPHRERL